MAHHSRDDLWIAWNVFHTLRMASFFLYFLITLGLFHGLLVAQCGIYSVFVTCPISAQITLLGCASDL